MQEKMHKSQEYSNFESSHLNYNNQVTKQRIKSMLYFYGIEFPKEFENANGHWSKRFISQLKTIQFQYSTGTDSLQLWIKEAERQREILLEATKKIKDLSKTERYSNVIELIRSISGIGLITGMILLVEIEEITRFEAWEFFYMSIYFANLQF